MKMKVLFVTNMYPTPESRGFGIFVEKQVELLRSSGITVDVFVIPQGGSKWKYVKAAFDLRSYLKDKQFDLIHVQYGLSGISTFFVHSVPIVATFHGSDVMYDSQLHFSRWLSRRTRLNIVMNEEMARRLENFKTLVQPMPVDDVFLRSNDREAIRRELGVVSDKFTILFPSNPGRKVKRYYIFESVVSEIELKLGKCRILTLSGNLPPHEVVKYYYAADLMILCSRSEGSPQCVKEALACGTPIASFDVGDVSKLTLNVPGTAVVTANDTDALARASVKLLHAGLRSDGRRKIEYLSLTEKDFIKRLLASYENVLSAR
jgi:teichuronic acid biosynthesis glycosyltransferase TuaC